MYQKFKVSVNRGQPFSNKSTKFMRVPTGILCVHKKLTEQYQRLVRNDFCNLYCISNQYRKQSLGSKYLPRLAQHSNHTLTTLDNRLSGRSTEKPNKIVIRNMNDDNVLNAIQLNMIFPYENSETLYVNCFRQRSGIEVEYGVLPLLMTILSSYITDNLWKW